MSRKLAALLGITSICLAAFVGCRGGLCNSCGGYNYGQPAGFAPTGFTQSPPINQFPQQGFGQPGVIAPQQVIPQQNIPAPQFGGGSGTR